MVQISYHTFMHTAYQAFNGSNLHFVCEDNQWVHFKGGNTVKSVSALSENGSALKGNNLLHLEASSFLSEQTLFRRGLV